MKFCLLLMVFTLISGCREEPPPEQESPLPFREIEQSVSGNQSIQGLRIARTREELVELWKDVHSGLSPAPDPPNVDLDQEMVVAYFAGSRNTGGYAVQVTDVQRHSGYLAVDVTEVAPGRNCIVTMAATGPVAVIAVKQSKNDVRASVTRRVVDCD